jgi:protein O-GlcNAc transferase
VCGPTSPSAPVTPRVTFSTHSLPRLLWLPLLGLRGLPARLLCARGSTHIFGLTAGAGARCSGSGVRDNPRSYKMHYSLAVSLGRGNRTLEAEAEAAYLESVRLNPEHADALNNLCLLLAGQGRHVEAEAQCRRAIEVRPTHAKAMSNLGMTLQAQKGKMAEAEAWHRRCVLIHLAMVPRLMCCNRCQAQWSGCSHGVEHQGDEDVSTRSGCPLRKSVSESNPQVYGSLLTDMKIPRKVERKSTDRQIEVEKHETHRALQLAPHDHKIHNNLGLLLSESGRLADAAAAFTAALAWLPSEAMYHNNLGSVHWKADELPAAEERFRTALRLQPDYASAMKNLVLLLHRHV